MTVLSVGDEIATYLAAQPALALTVATNLFVTEMPDSPDACVAVIETGGASPIMTLTGTAPGVGGQAQPESNLDRPTVQIRVRASMSGYVTGQALAQAIFKALQGIVETHINGSSNALFHLISALNPPTYIGRDVKERLGWTQNYLIYWNNPARS